MADNPQNKLLTRPEAAEQLSVSLRTLDEFTAKGELRHVKIGRSVRYRVQAIQDFVEANETAATPQRRRKARN